MRRTSTIVFIAAIALIGVGLAVFSGFDLQRGMAPIPGHGQAEEVEKVSPSAMPEAQESPAVRAPAVVPLETKAEEDSAGGTSLLGEELGVMPEDKYGHLSVGDMITMEDALMTEFRTRVNPIYEERFQAGLYELLAQEEPGTPIDSSLFHLVQEPYSTQFLPNGEVRRVVLTREEFPYEWELWRDIRWLRGQARSIMMANRRDVAEKTRAQLRAEGR